jgi:tape measure domain-containing protein
MGNALEFILKLQDMLTPSMRLAATVAETTSSKIQNNFDSITNKSKSVGSGIDTMKQKLESVNQVNVGNRIANQLDNATSSAKRLNNELQNTKSTTGGLGMIKGLLAGYGAMEVGKATLGAAAQREQQQIAFGVMTGSPEKGNKMLSDIVTMGAKTPYESADLIKSAQTLKAFGIENEKILPTLQMIGDVGAGDAEKLKSLSLAFAQVSSAGKLSGQDLLQMVNAGFNPLNEIAAQTGMKMADVRKAMEKGQISVGMVEQAFKRATGPGGMFNGMMEKQSQTLAGRWSTFMDGAKEKLLLLGNALMPIASMLLDFATALISGEPAAIAIAIAIGGIALSIWGVNAAAGAWATIMGIVNVVMAANPIILIISLLIALGVWIYSLASKYEGWGNSMKGLWEIIKGFVKLNVIAWKDFGENIWYWIQYAWLKVESFVQWIGGAMNNVFNALKLASQFKFAEAGKALIAEIKTTASVQLEELEKKHKAGALKNVDDSVAALRQMQAGYNMIGLKKKAEPVKAADATTMATSGKTTTTATGTAGLGIEGGKEKADAINSGGQRSIVINIGKQVEKMELHVASAKEGIEEMAALVREELRRTLYSLNGTTS